MALIRCNECGREVSDRAATCPHCGNPVAEYEYHTVTYASTWGVKGGKISDIISTMSNAGWEYLSQVRDLPEQQVDIRFRRISRPAQAPAPLTKIGNPYGCVVFIIPACGLLVALFEFASKAINA